MLRNDISCIHNNDNDNIINITVNIIKNIDIHKDNFKISNNLSTLLTIKYIVLNC